MWKINSSCFSLFFEDENTWLGYNAVEQGHIKTTITTTITTSFRLVRPAVTWLLVRNQPRRSRKKVDSYCHGYIRYGLLESDGGGGEGVEEKAKIKFSQGKRTRKISHKEEGKEKKSCTWKKSCTSNGRETFIWSLTSDNFSNCPVPEESYKKAWSYSPPISNFKISKIPHTTFVKKSKHCPLGN